MHEQGVPTTGSATAPAERVLPEPEAKPPRNKQALLVGDPGPLATVLQLALQRQGWEVICSHHAEEAVSLAETATPPLLVVSLDDSPRAREELVQAVRGLPKGESTVIVGVGRGLPARGLEKLLDDWVSLPLRPGELDWRLWLATSRADKREATPIAASELRLGDNAAATNAAGTLRGMKEAIGRMLRGLVQRRAQPREQAQITSLPEANLQAVPSHVAREDVAAKDVPVTPELVRGDPSVPSAPDGLWDWDLVTHRVTFSPELQALRGFNSQAVETTEEEFFSLVHPHDRESLKAAISAHLEQRTPHFESELRLRLRDGSWGWMVSRGIAFRDANGRAVRMVGSQSGLNRRTSIDPITGMHNRSYFLARLAQLLEAAHEPGSPQFAVLYFNLDRFKNVNYTLGHRVGDQLLAAVAGRLRDCLGSLAEGLASRTLGAHLGGNEFAILVEKVVATTEATDVAKAIQFWLRAPFVIEGQELFVTTSVGIATSERRYTRPEDILRDADAAAHQARTLGHSSYAIFQESMHHRAEHVLRLETDLRRAVQRNEFRVYYQPIVLLTRGTIAGFEALVRWQHPTGRLILPGDFIPLAEEIGVITEIDRWVLNEVCRQVRAWETQFRKRQPLTVAVNLSGLEFQKPEIAMEIDRALRSHGVWGRNLKIEITESVIMEQARYAADMLAHLRALDIKLSIDDFGTGYSSLSYLRRFEIDSLKIDKSFVGRMDIDQESEEIVRTIVTLARNLGKEIVAEGVERRRQFEQLVALGCTFGQGYLFSRPVDGRTATTLLAEEAAGSLLFRS